MQLLINIIVLASIYALIACGYVLIYRVSRVLNLAHGELMMLGAYLLLATASMFAANAALAIAAAVLLSVAVGILVYLFLMRRMTGEMVLAAILATVALGILVRGVLVLIWSSQQQYPGPGAARCKSDACIWQRAYFNMVLGFGARECGRLFWILLCSFASAVGACVYALPGRIRCWQHSAASICTLSMLWRGRFRR